jgi:tetratricopeptide (TPR) repeat protein
VIGDPLYRPYKKLNETLSDFKEDRDFKAIRLAQNRWADAKERQTNLTQASKKLKSGIIQEHFGMQELEEENWEAATESFTKARALYQNPADKLRQDLNLVELNRRQEKHGEALIILEKAQDTYAYLPEVKSVDGLITILDPPAPPPAKKK